MNVKIQPILMGLLRHLLTLIAGMIVTKGLVTEDTAQGVVGLILGLIGMLWSAQEKHPSTKALVQTPAERLDQTHQVQLIPFEDNRNSPPKQQQNPAQEIPTTTINSGFELSERSKNNLMGVHSKLVAVVELALVLSKIDFVVIEGLRTETRQKELIALGKSWVQRSKHQDGLAVDLMALPADGTGNWEPPHYDLINAAMQEAAGRLGVRLTWGGTWKMRDLVHFQIEGF